MLRNLIPFLAILPATAYSLLSLWCGWHFFRGQDVQKHAAHAKAISILKPVKGMEEDSYAEFRLVLLARVSRRRCSCSSPWQPPMTR